MTDTVSTPALAAVIRAGCNVAWAVEGGGCRWPEPECYHDCGEPQMIKAALSAALADKSTTVDVLATAIWAEYGTPPYAFHTLNPAAKANWRRIASGALTALRQHLLGEG